MYDVFRRPLVLRVSQWVCGSIALVSLLGASAIVTAQSPVAVPAVTVTGRPVQGIPITASEAVYHVLVQQTRAHDAVSILRPDYPRDSILLATTANAQRWMAQVESRSTR